MVRGKIIENDKVYTSSFGLVGKHVMSNRQVSISLSTPSTFKGSYVKALNPSWDLLNMYKSGSLSEQQYRDRYYAEVLDYLNPIEVYNQLKGKVICCWCGKGSFCHRQLVLEWLRDNIGDNVVGGEL